MLSDTSFQARVGKQFGVWDDLWSLEQRVTFILDRTGRVRFVEVGGLAIQTSRTLEALTALARAK